MKYRVQLGNNTNNLKSFMSKTHLVISHKIEHELTKNNDTLWKYNQISLEFSGTD